MTGNLEKAQQTCESWAQTYPREHGRPRIPGGDDLPCLRQIRKGGRRGQERVELDPDFAIGYFQLAFSYTYLDRLGEAENALQRASERKLEIPEFLVQRYDIAFLKGDKAGMEREAALGRGKSGAEDWMSDQRGFCPGIFRSLATGKADVTACGGFGSAGEPSGKGRRCTKPEQRCGKPFSGMRLRQGRARWRHSSFQRAGMWSMALPLPWPSRGILPGSQTLADDLERRVPGGYVSQIQLPAGASRTSRTEPWRACKGDRTATNRRSL